MQKKDDFFQKNLRISKICSTFAAGLIIRNHVKKNSYTQNTNL